jgi:ankyrin repeat protein
VAALIAAGACVQARCHDGVAALLMAAKSGRDELVRLRVRSRAIDCH